MNNLEKSVYVVEGEVRDYGREALQGLHFGPFPKLKRAFYFGLQAKKEKASSSYPSLAAKIRI